RAWQIFGPAAADLDEGLGAETLIYHYPIAGRVLRGIARLRDQLRAHVRCLDGANVAPPSRPDNPTPNPAQPRPQGRGAVRRPPQIWYIEASLASVRRRMSARLTSRSICRSRSSSSCMTAPTACTAGESLRFFRAGLSRAAAGASGSLTAWMMSPSEIASG